MIMTFFMGFIKPEGNMRVTFGVAPKLSDYGKRFVFRNVHMKLIGNFMAMGGCSRLFRSVGGVEIFWVKNQTPSQPKLS